MTVRPEDAARYLCELSDWGISNLHLQKILYLADMNFVGKNSIRLVSEDFEAWDFGPVIPSLYHQCKAFGAKKVPDIFWSAKDISGTREAAMLENAWQALRSQSPGQLVENTHWAGGAWAGRYRPGARGIKILSDDMINEYKNRRDARTRTN